MLIHVPCIPKQKQRILQELSSISHVKDFKGLTELIDDHEELGTAILELMKESDKK